MKSSNDLTLVANVCRLVGYHMPAVQNVYAAQFQDRSCRISCFAPSGITVVIYTTDDRVVSLMLVGSASVERIDLSKTTDGRGDMAIAEYVVENSAMLYHPQHREVRSFVHGILSFARNKEDGKWIASINN